MTDSRRQPWTGIQMGAHTLYDEGIEHALDLLRELTGRLCHPFHQFGWRGISVILPSEQVLGPKRCPAGRYLAPRSAAKLLWITCRTFDHTFSRAMIHDRSQPQTKYAPVRAECVLQIEPVALIAA